MALTKGEFKVDVTATIKGYEASLKQLQDAISKVDAGSVIGRQLARQFENARKQVDTLSKNATQRISSQSNITHLNDQLLTVGETIANVGRALQQVNGQDLNFSQFSKEIQDTTQKLDNATKSLSETIENNFQGTIQRLLNGKSGKFQQFLDAFHIDPKDLSYENYAETFERAFDQAREKAGQLKEEIKALEEQRKSFQDNANQIKGSNNFQVNDVVNKALGQFTSAAVKPQYDEKGMTEMAKAVISDLQDNLQHYLTPADVESVVNKTFETAFQNITDPGQLANVLRTLTTRLAANLKTAIHSVRPDVPSFTKTDVEQSLTPEVLKALTEKSSYTTDNSQVVNDFANAVTQLGQAFGTFNLEESKDFPQFIEQVKTAFESGDTAGAIQQVTQALQAYKDARDAVAQDQQQKANAIATQVADKRQEMKVAQGQAGAAQIYTGQFRQDEEALRARIEPLEKEIVDLRQQIQDLLRQQGEGREKAAQDVRGAGANVLKQTEEEQKKVNALTQEYNKQLEQVQARTQMVNKLEGLVQRWFSVYAVIRMVNNAINTIKNTLKELDKTITEIAIVTDMSQSELWSQMATYTETARKFGASISGVYQVSQLFYQQGLETNDVMSLTNETLKMARISGLSYVDATNYMTNALRSFKMEMTDSQRIVDVYSAIAASSATNTKELAVAMSKTASSAEAVGSSFENTTAMMAVMIEATREAPENIGSAMKSIISRYGELKTDPTKLVDSEGEVLSLNKVDAALQSVGVTLHDANGEFRNFDEVIMELAEKWNTLDKNSQRYIATVMAGNRQQSRFLALVSSYDRLKEESEIAADAQDTAQLQILKTMDSIEFKAQQLQTSIQSLYVDGGLQNLYKGILDFTNSIVTTFTDMPKLFNLPIPALMNFGLQFYSMAKLALGGLALIKQGYINQQQMIENAKKAITVQGVADRTQAEIAGQEQITQNAINEKKKEQAEETRIHTQGIQDRLNAERQAAAAQNIKIQHGDTYNWLQSHKSQISMGASAGGLILSSIGSQLKTSKSEGAQKGGALLNIGGSMLSGISMGAAGGPWGMVAGAAVGLITGVISNINIFYKSSEQKLKELKDAAEEANNTFITKRAESKDLAKQLEEYEKLRKAQYDSVEAQQAFFAAGNQLADQFPELIASIDAEGNATLKTAEAYDILAQKREEAAKSAGDVAIANFNVAAERLSQAQDLVQETYFSGLYDLENTVALESRLDELSRVKYLQDNYDALLDSGVTPNAIADYIQAVERNDMTDNARGVLDTQFAFTGYTPVQFNWVEQDEWLDTELGNALIDLQQAQEDTLLLSDEVFVERVNKHLEAIQSYLVDNNLNENTQYSTLYESYATTWDAALTSNEFKKQVSESLYQGSIAESGIRQTTASILEAREDWLKEIPGLWQVIEQDFVNEYNKQGDFTQKAYEEYIKNISGASVDVVFNDLDVDEWWKKSSNVRRQQLIDLVNNVNNLTRKQFENGLIDLGINPEKYVSAYFDNNENLYTLDMAKSAIREASGNRATLRDHILQYIDIYSSFGSDELEANVSFITNLLEQVQDGTLSETSAQNIIDKYTVLMRRLHIAYADDAKKIDIIDRELIKWIQDGTISGLDELEKNLQDADIDVNKALGNMTLDDIKQALVVNMTTLVGSLETSFSTALKEFDDTISDLNKGLKIEDASKFIQKMDLTWSDLQFNANTGLFEFNDYIQVRDKYFEQIQNDLDNINLILKPLKEATISQAQTHENLVNEYNQSLKDNELDKFLTQKYLQFDLSGKVANDTFFKEFTNYLQADTTKTFVEWLSETYDGVTQMVDDAITAHTAKAALDAGELSQFLQITLNATADDINDFIYQTYALDKVISPEIAAYGKELQETFQKNSETVLSAAIQTLGTSGEGSWVELNEITRYYLTQLGYDLDSVGDNIQNYFVNTTEGLREHIKEFLRNNKNLSKSDIAKYVEEIADAEKMTYEQVVEFMQGLTLTLEDQNSILAKVAEDNQKRSAVTVITDVLENFDKLSEDNIEALANRLGWTYDQVLAMLVQNADGTYTVDLNVISALISEFNLETNAAIQDALAEMLSSAANLIKTGLEGSLSRTDFETLSRFARNSLGIELDFSQTADGIKISNDSATDLYNKINAIDRASGKIVFDALRSSLEKSGEACENISKTMESIHNISKQNTAEAQKQLRLYKEIALAQMSEPDQYNFMDRGLSDNLQGPINYWNSVGTLAKTIRESASSGKMEVQDFQNIVNEMNTWAASSGKSLELFGATLDGSAESAARLIEKGFSALSNVDGEGVKIDLSKLGANFNLGAQALGKDTTEGLHIMANSQIEMLDGMIKLLETVVAMEKLADLDTNKNGGFEIHELFTPIFKGSDGEFVRTATEQTAEVAQGIIEAAKNQDGVAEDLQKIVVGDDGLTLYKVLEDLANKEELKPEQYKQYRKIFNDYYAALGPMLNSLDYDLDSLWPTISDIMKKTGATGEFDMGDTIFSVNAGAMTSIKFDEENEQYVAEDGKTFKTKEEAFNYAYALEEQKLVGGELTITETGTILTFKTTEGVNVVYYLDENGDPVFEYHGKTFHSQDEVNSYIEYEHYLYNFEGEKRGITPLTYEEWLELNPIIHISTNHVTIDKDQINTITTETYEEAKQAVLEGNWQKLQKLTIPGLELNLDEGDLTIGDIQSLQEVFGIDTTDKVVTIHASFAAEVDELVKKTLELINEDAGTINIQLNLSGANIANKDDLLSNLSMLVGGIDLLPVTVKALQLLKADPFPTDTKEIEDAEPKKLDDIESLIAYVLALNLMNPEGSVPTVYENNLTKPTQTNEAISTLYALVNALTLVQGYTSPNSSAIQESAEDVDLAIKQLEAQVNNLLLSKGGSFNVNSGQIENLPLEAVPLANVLTGVIQQLRLYYTHKKGSSEDLDESGVNVPEQLETQDYTTQALITLLQLAWADPNATDHYGLEGLGVSSGQPINLGEREGNVAFSKVNITNNPPVEDWSWLNDPTKKDVYITSGTYNVTLNPNYVGHERLRELIENGNLGGSLFLDTEEIQSELDKLDLTLKITPVLTYDNPTTTNTNDTTSNTSSNQSGQTFSASEAMQDFPPYMVQTNAALEQATQNTQEWSTVLGEIPLGGVIESFNQAVDAFGKIPSKLQSIKNSLNTFPYSKSIKLTVTIKTEADATSTNSSVKGTTTYTISYTKGNVALAGGKTKNVLMGELGPELYVTNGHYYVAGQNGAEFVDLPDDAIVFNHLQTKKLLNNGHGGRGSAITNERKATSFATGNVAMASAAAALAELKKIRAMWQSLLEADLSSMGRLGGSGGGGGGGGQEDAAYIADLERWYNLLRQIARLEQDINYEEKLRTKLQSDLNKNGKELYESQVRSLKNLEEQIKDERMLAELQKSYYEARRKDLENTPFSAIFTFDENGLMQYNDQATLANGQRGGLFALAELNKQLATGEAAHTAKEQYELLKAWGFEEYLKYDDSGQPIKASNDEGYNAAVQAFWDKVDGWKEELDSLYDSYTEYLEEIVSDEDARNKLLQEMVDNQLSLEKEILTAVEEREQAAIDKLEDTKDALKDAQDAFIDGLQNQMDQERQMYDRQQSDTELNKLRRQLSILQRTGGSASAISSLQNQITDAERSAYFDAQQEQLDAIRDASDKEIEKLEDQIDLMNESLEYQKDHGLLWAEVYEVMSWDAGAIADFITGNAKDWQSKSTLQMEEDLQDLRFMIDQYISRRTDVQNGNDYVGAGYADTTVSLSRGVVAQDLRPKPEEQEDAHVPLTGSVSKYYDETKDTIKSNKTAIKALQSALNEMGVRDGNGKKLAVDGIIGTNTKAAIANFQSKMGLPITKKFDKATAEAFARSGYDRGGLADYTGLAMVHGTKQRPEAFMDATTTKMWREDILSGKSSSLTSLLLETRDMLDGAAMNSFSTTANDNGINIEQIDVNMNIGSIASDYDIQRAGAGLRDELLKIARKTSVNSVGRR